MESHFYLLFRYKTSIKKFVEKTIVPICIGDQLYYRSYFLGESILIGFSQPNSTCLEELLKTKETVVFL